MSQIDYSKYTKDQLKEELRGRKQKLGGNKPELLQRLMEHINGVPIAGTAQVPAPAPVAAALPLAPLVPTAAPKAKKEAKNPVETLMSAVRNTGLPLQTSLSAVLAVYGVSDLQDAVLQLVADRAAAVPAPLQVTMTVEGLKTLKVEDLKKLLKDRNEKVGGKKEELIHRLLNPTPQAPNELPAPGVVVFPAAEQMELPPVPGVPTFPVGPTTPLAGGVGLPTMPAGLPTVPTGGLPTMGTLPTVPGLPVVNTLPVTSPRGTVSPRGMVTLPNL